MTNKILLFALIFSLGFLLSCGDNSTGTDPDPEEPNETEEPVVTTGTIEIASSTSGSGSDEDGYTVILDDTDSKSLDTNDTVTFDDVEEGSHSIELQDIVEVCAVDGDNPISADVTAEQTTTIQFDITCEQTTSSATGKIVYMKRVDQSTTELYIMNADGSGSQQVGDGIEGDYPAISPDGSQIAYVSSRAIWTVDIDGSNAQQLTSPEEFYGDRFPAWSPDGSKIVYQSAVEINYENYEIYTMDVDGTNQTRLTDHEADDERPDWSPDGATIIFHSDRDDDGVSELYAINVNSGEVAKLLEPTDDNGSNLTDPTWSPDGSQIAYQGYTSLGHTRIFIADADGENPNYITSTDVAAHQPTWSPDGNYIAFVNLSDGNKTNAIWTIRTDGSKETKLTDDQETYSSFPSWGQTIE